MTNETASVLLPSFEKEDVAEFNGSWGETSEIFFYYSFSWKENVTYCNFGIQSLENKQRSSIVLLSVHLLCVYCEMRTDFGRKQKWIGFCVYEFVEYFLEK